MTKPQISVLMPVKNAGPLLEDVLFGIAAQEGVAFELIIVDSGSSDGTLERVKTFADEAAFPVKVLSIEPAEFGHGKTRNFLARHARGDVLVYLTHDASPASKHWLAHHLEHYRNPKVGLVFGSQLPRPDAHPTVRAELISFFSGFAHNGAPTVYATEEGKGVDRSGAATDAIMRFNSNANASYRQEAWREINFRDVSYSEDQLAAQDILKAGWHKVFEPRAAVLHSHNFGTWGFFQRYVDEWHGMYQAFGHVEVKRFWHLPLRMARTARTNLRYLRNDPRLTSLQRMLWWPRVILHAKARELGGYIGPRLEKLPPNLARRLSREHKLINK